MVNLEKVRDTLSSAVTTGDEEALSQAQGYAQGTRDLLNELKSLNPVLAGEVNAILTDFNSYYSLAYEVSESMVNNTADFSKLGELSANMNANYDKATNALTKFRQTKLDNFEAAISDANNAAQSLIWLGVVVCLVSTVILFAVAFPIVQGIKGSINTRL